MLNSKPRILLTNDDGIESPSLWAVHDALADMAHCEVVAPRHPKSASSHAISLYSKIRLERMRHNGRSGYGVHGTPADAVKLALCELFKGKKIDLIISGINLGPNTGVSVYYSGTIAAAREAVISGVPAFAVSIAAFMWNQDRHAVEIVKSIAAHYLSGKFPPDCFLNVNIPGVPADEIRGIAVTRQAPSRFLEEFVRESDAGGDVYRLKGSMFLLKKSGQTDQEALEKKYISITPLALDTTHYPHIAHVEAFADGLRNGKAMREKMGRKPILRRGRRASQK